MLKQVTSEIIISFDDTHNGTNHVFWSDNQAQAKSKAIRLLANAKSGNVIIKHAASDAVLDYYEK